jgi:hypothetical protein
MNQVTTCSSNVFAMNANTLNWMETFCTCPQAKQLVDEGDIKSILINIGDFANTKIKASSYPQKIEIYIPEESSSRSPIHILRDLAMEFFYVKNYKEKDKLNTIASSGKLGMDNFARKIVADQYESMVSQAELESTCKKEWKIANHSHVNTIRENYPIESYLLNAEASCQIDSIRKRWINTYQEIYCRKNPKDIRSCNIKKSELCDYSEVEKMPPKEREKLITKRLCETYFKLPESEKKVMSNYIEVLCSPSNKVEL